MQNTSTVLSAIAGSPAVWIAAILWAGYFLSAFLLPRFYPLVDAPTKMESARGAPHRAGAYAPRFFKRHWKAFAAFALACYFLWRFSSWEPALFGRLFAEHPGVLLTFPFMMALLAGAIPYRWLIRGFAIVTVWAWVSFQAVHVPNLGGAGGALFTAPFRDLGTLADSAVFLFQASADTGSRS